MFQKLTFKSYFINLVFIFNNINYYYEYLIKLVYKFFFYNKFFLNIENLFYFKI
jgi:hypothetical protein